MTAKPAVVRVCGPFQADPDLPPDHNGRHVCVRCHLPGWPGDAHHTLPAVPEQAEHRHRVDVGDG